MPTFLTTDMTIEVRETDGVTVDNDGRRIRVTYTTPSVWITSNGHSFHVMSPAQYRAIWSVSGEEYLRVADQTEKDPDQAAKHYLARGNAMAFASAIDIMDKLGDDAGTAGPALRETAKQVRAQIPTGHSDGYEAGALQKAAERLESLARRLDTIGQFTWIED